MTEQMNTYTEGSWRRWWKPSFSNVKTEAQIYVHNLPRISWLQLAEMGFNLAVDCMPKVCCGNLIWLNLPPQSKLQIFIFRMFKLPAISNSLALPSVGVLPSLSNNKLLWFLEDSVTMEIWGHYYFRKQSLHIKCSKYQLGSLFRQIWKNVNPVCTSFNENSVAESSISFVCVCSSMSHSVTLWTAAFQAPLSMGFFSKNTGMSCHFLLQGIFLTQGSNLCLLCLLHCR